MENLRPTRANCDDDQFAQSGEIDWRRVEALADVTFGPDIRRAIENELNWHSIRWSEYARDADVVAYRKAFDSLSSLVKTPSSKDRMLPIEYELERVLWFLEIMSQALDADTQKMNVDYLLYSKIWSLIGKAGVSLTRGKGLPTNRLLKAQRVFKEICAQAGIKFSNSDQALAQALQRALKLFRPHWDK